MSFRVNPNAAAVALAIGQSGAALAAIQIDQTAFSGNQVVEGFEGFSAGPNAPLDFAGVGLLTIGKLIDFDFGSGVTLTAPIPNPDTDIGILDEAIDPIGWGLGANGNIASASDIPAGTACLVMETVARITSYELTFEMPQARVGALVTSVPGLPISFEAFNEGGLSLGSVSVPAVHVASWGSNFLGIQDLRGIKRIVVSGDTVVMDELMFETANVWTEIADARQDGIDEAQLTWGPGPLGAIEGVIGSAQDVDLYCIRVTDEASFSATTLDSGISDTTLYLFDVQGNPIAKNDDIDSGGENLQSVIDSTLVSANGVYFLAVSGFRGALDSSGAHDENGDAIFDQGQFDGQTTPYACGGAERPTCNPISGRLSFWGASSQSNPGAYIVELTGAECCAPRCPATLGVPGGFATIGDAMSAAVDGDTVLVGPGVYDESDLAWDGKLVHVRSSHGPEHTVIAKGSGRLFVDATANGPLAIFEGITVTGNMSPSILYTSATIRDCVIDTTTGGAAFRVDGAGRNPIFDRCTFRNIASGDLGGAAQINAGPFVRFVNCGFFDNQASHGAGIYFFAGSGEVLGCTFAGLSAIEGSAIYVQTPAVVSGANNIFFANSGSQFRSLDPNAAFANSLFAGGTGTNIDANPEFIDALSGDYRLDAGSPAIDAGNCTLMPPGATVSDASGGPRLVNNIAILDIGPACGDALFGGAMDMGCFESGRGAGPFCLGDADGNGEVDFGDVTTVLGNWLAVCP